MEISKERNVTSEVINFLAKEFIYRNDPGM